jgi:hypothetical protein
MSAFKDIWSFMKHRKKFWMAPLIIIIFILGILIIVGGSSSAAPFIYSIF